MFGTSMHYQSYQGAGQVLDQLYAIQYFIMQDYMAYSLRDPKVGNPLKIILIKIQRVNNLQH